MMNAMNTVNPVNQIRKNNFIKTQTLTKETLDYIYDMLITINGINKEDCKEVMGSSGYCDLLITSKGKTYKAEVDIEEECIKLMERNTCGNPKLKEQYHLVREVGDEGCFFGATCWYNLFRAISLKGLKGMK